MSVNFFKHEMAGPLRTDNQPEKIYKQQETTRQPDLATTDICFEPILKKMAHHRSQKEVSSDRKSSFNSNNWDQNIYH